MQFISFIFQTVVNYFCFVCNNSKHGPIVATDYGKIEGLALQTTLGFKADVFLGIPYAKPPIGDLRFEVSFYAKLRAKLRF